ncbi:MAG: RluA family pseudouridine synthase [Lachnospira sp.]|nr:RluA family pseudouridine synthase [Lachnospira sp.]
MSSKIIIKNVEPEYNGQRIDKFLSETLPEYSRSFIQKVVKDGGVLVDEKCVKSNYKLSAGQILKLNVPELVEPDIIPEDIALDILYEDDDIIVVNKPKGMVVHPAAGHYTGTLVNALMYHCRDNLSGINGVTRPGIVHRIDMNTTGVLVACKNDAAHIFLSEQLAVHSITRKYNAIVHNSFKDNSGTVDAPIGRHQIDRKKMAIDYKNGRNAVTHYSVISNYGKYAHIECQLETGRTHQIRVHMSSIGHPLLGDDVYGSGKSPYRLEGQTLHARVLGFVHPSTGKYMEFEAPLPDYFKEIIVDLENKCK